MNFFKRALLSVSRKKGKSFILFLVIFILGNVIAGAIAVRQATQNVEKNTKQKLGALATIDMDYEKMNELPDEEEMQMLTVEQIKKIGESPYVKYYDYSLIGGVETTKLKAAPENTEEDAEIYFSSEMNYFSYKGTNYPAVLDVEEKHITIKEGRTFTAEEIEKGEQVALISAEVAEVNGLSVGDQMVIDQLNYMTENPEDAQTIDAPVKVIGIFTVNQKKVGNASDSENARDQMQFAQQQTQKNTIYLPNKAVQSMNQAMYAEVFKDEDMPTEEYYTPLFILNSPDEVDAFKEETQPLVPDYYKIQTSADQYDQVAGSMNQLSNIARYVVIIAVGATLLIISLVVLLFLRDRKHELGIYLSLGEKKSYVIGQVLIETLLISSVALILSLVTGHFLGEVVSDSLLKGDLLATANHNQDMMYQYVDVMNQSVLTEEEILTNYSLHFSFGYILSYLAVGLSTVVVSVVLPVFYISRLNPKKIMM